MDKSIQTRVRQLWRKLQERNKPLCKEWLCYDTFKKDILTLEGSDAYKKGVKCVLKIKQEGEYNKDNCYFKEISLNLRDTAYEPSLYELNYLYKCINNEIAKYAAFNGYYDELRSIGNFALGKACCTYNGSNEFKYYALKCIQNDIRTYIKNNLTKVQNTISADKDYSPNDEDYSPLLDVISKDDSFKEVDLNLILEEELSTWSEVDKTIIEMSMQGYFHQEIGDVVGLSESYVGRKIKKLNLLLESIVTH